MTAEELRKILARGEDIVTEYKTCKDKIGKSVYETVCSFSNRYGGHLILGVSDDGSVIGIEPFHIQKLKTDFVNAIGDPDKMNPTLYLEIEDYEIDGKTILHVYIPISSQVEMCVNKIFDRVGAVDKDITKSTDRVAELFARKSREHTERRVFPLAEERHFRFAELIPKIRRMASVRKPEHPWLNMDDMDIIRSAGLYEDSIYAKEKGFNLACILLFGKDETIRSALSGYVTDCLVRREDLDRYDDRLMVKTNLIESFSLVMDFIAKHTPDSFYLEGVQNVSVRGKIAREIVSNSLAHREYDTTIPARVIIERDRIYADNWNRSLTYGKLDPKKFSPQPKNPIIAQFFESIGYADKLGSGVRNLYHYTPIWANGVLPELIEDEIFKTIVPLPESFRIEYDGVSSSRLRVTDRVIDRVTDGVTDGEQEVIDLLEENNEYTLNELAKILSVSRKTIAARVKRLKEKGAIERAGSDRSGYWKIKKR
jgi:ATP-dependent DNA helicase RecG